MRNSRPSLPINLGTRQTYAERVTEFIRRKHPYKTAENVAADTGIKYHTIRKLLEGLNAPSIVAFDRLARAYGLEFVHHVFAWDFLDPDKRAAEQRALEARFVALVDEMKELNTRG